jgi:DNA-binding transcriptional regulator LsrR (DeoR family)
MTEEDKIIYAAWNYYHNNLTQNEIAKRMNISRATVGRLLEKARSDGIVQIKITKPIPKHFYLEEQFTSVFNLSDVVIVEPGIIDQDACDVVGQAAAELLTSILYPGCKLGLAWSRTASHMVEHLNRSDIPPNISIHDLAGTFLENRTDFAVSWRVAEKLKVSLDHLPVPVVMDNSEAREAILKEKSIRLALSNAGNVDIAIVGLGSIDQDSSLIKANYMNISQMTDISQKGAVGEILMRFYNITGGQVISEEFENRTIGLSWDQIQNVDRVIALATGTNKVKPILGAIRAGAIKGLVTDTATAEEVLAYSKYD